MSLKKGWRVATAPASYGAVDDARLCRHVRVKRASSLAELKAAVLAAYEDQYEPSEISLFTRKYDDDPMALRTDRQAALATSYQADWESLAEAPSAPTVLLVVSAMNEEENELLVLPAAHSAPAATLLQDMAPGESSVFARAALPAIEKLAGADAALFDPLPLPAHVDDWLAQYREAPQTVQELLASERGTPAGGRRAICLQPLVRKGGPTSSERELFGGLHGYLTAFFDGQPVELLPALEVEGGSASQPTARLLGKKIRWRDRCPVSGTRHPDGQLSAPQILETLKPKFLRGAIKGGVMPPHGFCVLGVTTVDLFCDDDDEFTGGLACLRSRAGLFSFHRYPSHVAHRGQGRLALAAKTAAHEVLHMYGIGHCLRRACLMNGCGHLLEDFAAPPYLCPVCLSKLVAVLAPSTALQPRYRAMLAFCEAKPGFAEHARWLRRAIEVVQSGGGGGGVGSTGGRAAAVQKSLSKRPASSELLDKGILKSPPGRSPLLAEKAGELEKARTKDALAHSLERRPESAELQEKGILKSPPGRSPLLAEKAPRPKRERSAAAESSDADEDDDLPLAKRLAARAAREQ